MSHITDQNSNNPLTLKDIMDEIKSTNSTVNQIKSSVNSIENRLNSLEELKITVHKVEKSQNFLNGQFEELKVKAESIEKDNKSLRNENTHLNRQIKELTEDLDTEKFKRNQLEQYGRREMLEISGVPQLQNENCTNIAYDLCKLTDCNMEMDKIEVAHRIKNGDIIVKFKDRPSRDTLFIKKSILKEKSARDLGFNSDNSIFINESLSFDTRTLLFETRKKCRALGYKKIVTDKGTIKVKVDDKNGVTWWAKIRNKKDGDDLK